MTTEIMPGCEPFSATGSSNAVLVLHGFTGSPQSMRPLAVRLAEAEYSVELPRLPGHGTSVEDLMTTTWDDWATSAEAAYEELLGRCENVAVVGLSMGGALTAYLAQRHDVAACVFINPQLIRPAKDLVEGLAALLEAGVTTIDPIAGDIKKEGVVETTYPSMPLSSIGTFFAAMAGVEDHLSSITAPTLLLSSRDDHVVPSENGDALMAHCAGPIQRVWLENSYHVATLDNDAAFLESEVLSFLERVFA